MNKINLAGGVIVTATPPAAGFDPSDASNEALKANGLPPRHIDSMLNKHQDDVFYSKFKDFSYIYPVFEVNINKSHGKMITEDGNSQSNNWSGALVNPAKGQSMATVSGTWTVPKVSAGSGSAEIYYCCSWVGIDGSSSDGGSTDVCQAGVATNYDVNQKTQTTYPWWEWYPNYEVKIKNFCVSPGDSVMVTVTTKGSGANTAAIVFTNIKTKQYTSFSIEAPDNVTLVGNCAEWIVEASKVHKKPTILANYGSVNFTYCGSAQANDTPVTLTGASTIYMTQGGKTVSKGSIENATTALCQYQ